MEIAVLKTEDKITVRTGAQIWYVNYLHEIKPTVFKLKGKGTVKYFALRCNACKWLEDAECYLDRHPKLRLSDIINRDIFLT